MTVLKNILLEEGSEAVPLYQNPAQVLHLGLPEHQYSIVWVNPLPSNGYHEALLFVY